MLYSMSFLEWIPEQRIIALKELGFEVSELQKGTVNLKFGGCDQFGSAHTEAAKFICDPVYNPKMYNMDKQICTIVNNLHHDFWTWRHHL